MSEMKTQSTKSQWRKWRQKQSINSLYEKQIKYSMIWTEKKEKPQKGISIKSLESDIWNWMKLLSMQIWQSTMRHETVKSTTKTKRKYSQIMRILVSAQVEIRTLQYPKPVTSNGNISNSV